MALKQNVYFSSAKSALRYIDSLSLENKLIVSEELQKKLKDEVKVGYELIQEYSGDEKLLIEFTSSRKDLKQNFINEFMDFFAEKDDDMEAMYIADLFRRKDSSIPELDDSDYNNDDVLEGDKADEFKVKIRSYLENNIEDNPDLTELSIRGVFLTTTCSDIHYKFRENKI